MDEDFDSIEKLSHKVEAVANAITPLGAVPARDSHDGYISSLTEATLSVSISIDKLADAFSHFADMAEAFEDFANSVGEIADTVNRLAEGLEALGIKPEPEPDPEEEDLEDN